MARKLGSWIDAFYKFMDNKGSPPIFTRWAGIFAVAAALERKTWIRSAKGVLYPNVYTIIVGPPGTGKTLATKTIRGFLLELNEHHIAPSSVTKASLIDALASAERSVVRPMENPPVLTFNSLVVTSNELGVFLPSYEPEFMNVLTDIYDGDNYSETRRTNKLSINIDAPQINLIAATTPSYLSGFLPEGAWDQGFLSRCILVYSGGEGPTSLFAENDFDKELETKLLADLKEIGELKGKFSFTEEAKEAIEAWHLSGGAPAPMHPKLTHYNTRRSAHLLKLSMIASAADNNSLVITLDHFVEALDWLTQAEGLMPDIFKSMKTGGDGRIIEECYHFAYEAYIKKKEPVLEHRLIHFLQERTPAHNVERILSVMEKAGFLRKEHAKAGLAYVPLTKAA